MTNDDSDAPVDTYIYSLVTVFLAIWSACHLIIYSLIPKVHAIKNTLLTY